MHVCWVVDVLLLLFLKHDYNIAHALCMYRVVHNIIYIEGVLAHRKTSVTGNHAHTDYIGTC